MSKASLPNRDLITVQYYANANVRLPQLWKAQKPKRERFLSDSYLEIARNGPVFQECVSVLATDSKSKSENKQIVCSFEVYKFFEALKARI
jgi:hypothetical protein